MEEYLVYAHRDYDGKVFYIGSGRAGREREKGGRSRAWYERVKSLNGRYEVLILTRHESRREALVAEEEAIAAGGAGLINRKRGRRSDLGSHVRARRRAVGLTQAEMALRAGVGLRFVRELECGKGTIRMDTVDKVLRLFGEELGAVPMRRV